ncbi:class I SAM-dependent methyltransferase, partial [bacterium]|nr:class I SAM-dependent methyltransferase [candidate division CSSED10-310 bacterium]
MDVERDRTLADEIRKAVEAARVSADPEYLSLMPRRDALPPDPDTDKGSFSSTRRRYEDRLDAVNAGTLTGREFETVEALDEAIGSVNRIVAELTGTSAPSGFLQRIISRGIIWAMGGEFHRIRQSVSDLTRCINALNHKTRIFAANQQAFNTDLAEFGQSIVPVIDEKIRIQLERTARYLKDRMDVYHEGTDRRQTEIANWLHHATDVFDACRARVDALDSELQRGLALQHRKIERLLTPAGQAACVDSTTDTPASRVSDPLHERSASADTGSPFAAAGGEYAYYMFENTGRGSESFIRERQAPYVRFFQNVPGPVIDIGCGRGEFLTLLREAGVPSRGFDSNADMVGICREKGLDVEAIDGIRGLESVAKDSLGGVFAAQVVEHLPSPALIRWLQAAFHALAPGGVLVYETINTASPFALVTHYFKDPTHAQPRHPDTYAFLTQ